MFWHVVIPVPLHRTFVYDIPAELGTPEVGARVLLPFGRRRITGYLLKQAEVRERWDFSIKKAISLLDETPSVPGELFDFLAEAAAYYMHPLGEVVRTALPPGMDYREKNGELEGPRVGPRKVTMVRAIAVSAGQARKLTARAPRRAELLQKISAASEVSLTELTKADPRAGAHVKRLAADGLVATEEKELAPNPFTRTPLARDEPPTLSCEQSAAVSIIEERLERGGYRGFLLHGVTGSGKTEVYLRSIARTRELGKGALVLVPEISLTPQLVDRYRARFGDELAVWHSALTERERFDQWQLLRSGRVRVAIGVRSSVFAPVQNLGIVVVDEEHDGSFKQERGFRYNARDLALLRAARTGAVALLGSATPSLETYRNCETGKLKKIDMKSRVTAHPLPEVDIVDLTSHRSGPGNQRLITQPLYEKLTFVLKRGEQAILFLNRRGFAPALLCSTCGQLLQCRSCAVSLTLHRKPPGLVCHYCGHRRAIPENCSSCGSKELVPVGSGTQKAEEVIAALFPNAKVARLDRDTGSGKRAEAVLQRLRRREIDILVGTQMVTKGHDFPWVTLVGVLNADVGLHVPDFRAAERTFQLLTQVAGRAGRSDRGGRAMIQTYNPEHIAIKLARAHDFYAFASYETVIREELGYPPFGRLAALRLSSTNLDKLDSEANRLFSQLRQIKGRQGQKNLDLLGPVPAPLSQLKGRYRYRILIRAPRQDQIRRLLEPLLSSIEAPKSGIRIAIDIDPVSML